MEDEAGSARHIEELGIDPEFRLDDQIPAVPKDSGERLAETRARLRAIEEQRKERQREVAKMRRGSVVPDHGDSRGDGDNNLTWRADLWGYFD